MFNTLGCDSIVYTEVVVYDQYNSIFNGISDNTVGGGGYYNSQSQYLIFNCYTQTEILSSLVYSQDTNAITFELRDNNGNVLQDTPHLLVPGPQRVILNFDVMPANDLQLGVSTPGSGLWRNNQGVNYPYDFGAFASITSSNAGNQYYYFYYDIEVKVPCLNSTSAVEIKSDRKIIGATDFLGREINQHSKKIKIIKIWNIFYKTKEIKNRKESQNKRVKGNF